MGSTAHSSVTLLSLYYVPSTELWQSSPTHTLQRKNQHIQSVISQVSLLKMKCKSCLFKVTIFQLLRGGSVKGGKRVVWKRETGKMLIEVVSSWGSICCAPSTHSPQSSSLKAGGLPCFWLGSANGESQQEIGDDRRVRLMYCFSLLLPLPWVSLQVA